MIDPPAGRSGRARFVIHLLLPAVALVAAGCAAARPGAVTPQEIPILESRLRAEPENGDVRLRLAAALFSTGQCDSAIVIAESGMRLKPTDALGPLVVGQCLEQRRDWDGALAVYRTYVAANPERAGAAAMRARETLVLREQANGQARQALAQETEIAAQAPDPQTLAVLPLFIVADSMYQPLSVGLAQIITSDLALLQQFRLVERLQLSALLDEMELGAAGAVDPATVARAGRMLRAGRMVQGLAAIPPRGTTRLEATVVLSDGSVTAPVVQTGAMRDLLKMEKQIVVDIADQLGYRLSEAEMRAVLENGTQNLAAFLAYSRGLAAERMGDYNAAAFYYQEAVRQDPGFQEAREQFEATVVVSEVVEAAPAEVTTVAVQPPPEVVTTVAETPVSSAVSTTVVEIAGTQAEQTASVTPVAPTGTQTATSQPPPTTTVTGTPTTATGTVRIFFRLP